MMYRLYGAITVLIFFAVIVVNDLAGGDWGRLAGGFDNLVVFFNQSMWPPNWIIFDPVTYPVCNSRFEFMCSIGYSSMYETLQIAFASTIFGFMGAILLSPLAARNLRSNWIGVPVRILLSAIRSLPALIWAIIFVIVVGFGPFSGVLAMTLYTIGYLGKLQYETFEGMDSGPLEAGRAMGLSNFSITNNIVIPENSNHILSQLIFMFEYNVRHSTVIGIVGAGGVGFFINNYMKLMYYDRVFALLIMIFVVVIIIDFVSYIARSFVNEQGDVRRPSWLSVLMRMREKKASSKQSD